MLWQYQETKSYDYTEVVILKKEPDDTNLKKPSNIGDIIDMMVHVEINSSWLQRNMIIKSFRNVDSYKGSYCSILYLKSNDWVLGRIFEFQDFLQAFVIFLLRKC